MVWFQRCWFANRGLISGATVPFKKPGISYIEGTLNSICQADSCIPSLAVKYICISPAIRHIPSCMVYYRMWSISAVVRVYPQHWNISPAVYFIPSCDVYPQLWGTRISLAVNYVYSQLRVMSSAVSYIPICEVYPRLWDISQLWGTYIPNCEV